MFQVCVLFYYDYHFKWETVDTFSSVRTTWAEKTHLERTLVIRDSCLNDLASGLYLISCVLPYKELIRQFDIYIAFGHIKSHMG